MGTATLKASCASTHNHGHSAVSPLFASSHRIACCLVLLPASPAAGALLPPAGVHHRVQAASGVPQALVPFATTSRCVLLGAASLSIGCYWVLHRWVLGAASLDVACSGFALLELPLPGHVCAALYLGSTWLPGPVLAACGLAQPSLGAPPIRHAHPTPAVPWPLLRSLGMPQMGSYAFAPRNSHQNKLGTSTTSKSIRIKGFGGGTMGSMLTVQWVACSQHPALESSEHGRARRGLHRGWIEESIDVGMPHLVSILVQIRHELPHRQDALAQLADKLSDKMPWHS